MLARLRARECPAFEFAFGLEPIVQITAWLFAEIGDAKTVAKKILYVNDVLGGISRITFPMGVSTLPHQKMLDAIEILGTVVAPIVRNELGVTAVRCLMNRALYRCPALESACSKLPEEAGQWYSRHGTGR